MIFQASAPIFGNVQNPISYGDIGDTSRGGLTGFLTTIIVILVVAAGLFSLFNFITAGMSYITSQGNPEGIQKAKTKIYMSVIGLVIIVGSFAFAAIIGQLFFGNPNFILNPSIQTAPTNP